MSPRSSLTRQCGSPVVGANRTFPSCSWAARLGPHHTPRCKICLDVLDGMTHDISWPQCSPLLTSPSPAPSRPPCAPLLTPSYMPLLCSLLPNTPCHLQVAFHAILRSFGKWTIEASLASPYAPIICKWTIEASLASIRCKSHLRMPWVNSLGIPVTMPAILVTKPLLNATSLHTSASCALQMAPAPRAPLPCALQMALTLFFVCFFLVLFAMGTMCVIDEAPKG